MLIQSNTQFNRKSVQSHSVAFGIKPIKASEIDFSKYPHLKNLLSTNPDIVVSPKTTDLNAVKEANKLIKNIEAKMSGIQRDLNKLKEILPQNAVIKEQNAVVEQKNTNDIESLSSLLQYNNKYYKTFMNVLNSDKCKEEHCLEILDNLHKIRGDYRKNILDKLLDFSLENNNHEVYRRTYTYTCANTDKYYHKEKIIPNSLKYKFTDVAMALKNDRILQNPLSAGFFRLENGEEILDFAIKNNFKYSIGELAFALSHDLALKARKAYSELIGE